MYSRTDKIFILVSIALGAACCDPFEGLCDDEFRPAIELTVKNRAGEYVNDQVFAVVFDDHFLDTLTQRSFNQQGEMISLAGAGEREGMYSLIITSDIYQTYTDTQITVRNGRCHVKTKKLSVIVDLK